MHWCHLDSDILSLLYHCFLSSLENTKDTQNILFQLIMFLYFLICKVKISIVCKETSYKSCSGQFSLCSLIYVDMIGFKRINFASLLIFIV